MTKGLYFRIFFGANVPRELRQFCCVSSEGKLLFTRDCEDGLIETWRKLNGELQASRKPRQVATDAGGMIQFRESMAPAPRRPRLSAHSRVVHPNCRLINKFDVLLADHLNDLFDERRNSFG